MDNHTADAYVDTALGLTTALYALLLDYNKRHAHSEHKIDPDWTAATVALGCGLCLAAAMTRVRLTEQTDRAATERSVRRAFLVGGGPIVVWQIWRGLQRFRSRAHTLRHYIAEDTHAKSPPRQRPPATVAPLRWPGQSPN